MAKALLPEFGGSAGVWVTCMLFFQVMLLFGYLYSWLITTHLSRRAQSWIHAGLLLLSLTTISFRPRLDWFPPATGNPALSILGVLLVSIGLPYFLLSTTSPLLQAWFAESSPVAFPYWLFALSNAASLLALLAYPFVIEPLLPQSSQLHWWWLAYAALVVLACAAALLPRPLAPPAATESRPVRPLLWIVLAACGSVLWMAVANHLSQEVAPVPFLWVLPLSIYLLTFILCFEGEGWYRPALFRWLLPVAWCCAAYRLAGQGPAGLTWELTTFSAALFVWCMFCHGEIARTKPTAAGPHTTGSEVTRFYLAIAFGGAVGALLVGLAAPNLLSTYLELPLGIAASVLLALYLLYGIRSPKRLLRLGLVALIAFVVATRFEAGFGDVIHVRNFYGALQVSDAGAGDSLVRTLYNGKTLHGVEFLSPDRLRLPTAYYGPDSGAGRMMLLPRDTNSSERRVGLVGLGVGTLATYGRDGDVFRFYEINPAVIDVASHYFHFLELSKAKINLVEGDGRLALEREPSNSFDLLVLDAFADDSIPVHLLTSEAFSTYFRVLRGNGILAIHLTNRFLDLAPVVHAAAAHMDKQMVEVHSAAEPNRQILAADWALVSQHADVLKSLGGVAPPTQTVRLWTDDYSNLFRMLK
jgi:SAM-dependent methyltransferase